ncbi:MAG: nucleoside monophosphate kinase [Candidatus Blackburnbacteria bacterium]|nr:nucleoside monophosphate kinase [Candidatus Blackburnbacteria bacterium]
MIIIILGPVGSGKSTQAQILADEIGAIHLNTGDLLYYASQETTPEATTIKETMDRGEIVNDNIVTKLVLKHINEHKGEDFVIEGFPRTVYQAKKSGIKPNYVIYITLPDRIATERMLSRGRRDDTAETIVKRLKIYHEETAPILEYYKSLNVLKEINGESDIAEVAKDVAGKINV